MLCSTLDKQPQIAPITSFTEAIDLLGKIPCTYVDPIRQLRCHPAWRSSPQFRESVIPACCDMSKIMGEWHQSTCLAATCNSHILLLHPSEGAPRTCEAQLHRRRADPASSMFPNDQCQNAGMHLTSLAACHCHFFFRDLCYLCNRFRWLARRTWLALHNSGTLSGALSVMYGRSSYSALMCLSCDLLACMLASAIPDFRYMLPICTPVWLF